MKHRHFMLFKPCGYLSQFRNNGPRRHSKKLLGGFSDFPAGIMAVGRLDENSEGLLLLTTDGKVSDRICRGGLDKEYYAQVDGEITEAALERMREGVEIGVVGEKYHTKTCTARVLKNVPDLPKGRKIRDARHGPTSWVSITVREGKNRQVRKMTAAVGFPTLRLIRVRIGTLFLNGMLPGEVREVQGFFS